MFMKGVKVPSVTEFVLYPLQKPACRCYHTHLLRERSSFFKYNLTLTEDNSQSDGNSDRHE